MSINYLSFTSNGDSTIRLKNYRNEPSIEYSLDNG